MSYKTKKIITPYSVLIPFSSQLLITKYINYDQIYVSAYGPINLSAFKKCLFNRVSAANNILMPGYNRRKHGISHGLLINNPLRQLSKTFGYMSRKYINFNLSYVLSTIYGSYAKQTKTHFCGHANFKYVNRFNYSGFENANNYAKFFDILINRDLLNNHEKKFKTINNVVKTNLKVEKAVKFFVHVNETRTSVLLWRIQGCKTVYHALHWLNANRSKIKTYYECGETLRIN